MKPRGGATCSRGSRWGSGGVLAFARFFFLLCAIVRSRYRRQSDDASSGGAKMSNCEVVGIDGEGPSKHRERLFLPPSVVGFVVSKLFSRISPTFWSISRGRVSSVFLSTNPRSNHAVLVYRETTQPIRFGQRSVCVRPGPLKFPPLTPSLSSGCAGQGDQGPG